MLFKTGWFLQKFLYPMLTWKKKAFDKEIFLTFDDGPNPKTTPYILEELNKYDAKATFFCIGDNVNKYPRLFSRIINEGHSIGNHTHKHLNGWAVDDYEYQQDIKRCQMELLAQGYHSFDQKPLFRPPYGRIKFSQIGLLKKEYNIIMWDVLSGDYKSNLTPERCLKKTKRNIEPGSIIVFHDSLKAESNLTFVLPKILHHFQQQGFSFVKL